MKSFKQSQDFAFARFIRAEVRKTDVLTKSQQAVTIAVVNLWFYHKNGPVRLISPGRGVLAKKANVTEKTVSRTLTILRQAGALVAVSSLRGEGQKHTRYKLRLVPLMLLLGCDLPEWLEGELKPLVGTENGGKMAHQFGPKCPTTFAGNVPPLVGQNVPRISYDGEGSLSPLSKDPSKTKNFDGGERNA